MDRIQRASGRDPEPGDGRDAGRADGRDPEPGDGRADGRDPDPCDGRADGRDAALDALLTAEGRALVDRLTPYDPAGALSALAAARRDPRWAPHPEVVAAAATQARLRTRAVERFPGRMRWWTPDGLEQATRPAVARRHAQRYLSAGVRRVIDLGCGAGSDALALAEAGVDVLAVDRDPSALWALGATASDWGLPIRTLRADVTGPGLLEDVLGPSGSDGQEAGGLARRTVPVACFVDPARRADGSRLRDPEAWSPPWSWVRALAAAVPATGAKLAPGIAHGVLPEDCQAEWVSQDGDLLEATAWWGPLRQGSARRIACVLPGTGAAADPLEPGAATLDDTGGVPDPRPGPVGRWVVEPDPAVIRSGLVMVLADRMGGWLIDPRIAYITADAVPEPGRLGTRYEVLDILPLARRALRARLRALGYGDVIVKKRGLNVVPEEMRSALRLGGDGPTATLMLTRTDTGPLALLVRRA